MSVPSGKHCRGGETEDYTCVTFNKTCGLLNALRMTFVSLPDTVQFQQGFFYSFWISTLNAWEGCMGVRGHKALFGLYAFCRVSCSSLTATRDHCYRAERMGTMRDI